MILAQVFMSEVFMSHPDAYPNYTDLSSSDCISSSSKTDVCSQTHEEPLLSETVTPQLKDIRRIGLYSEDGTYYTTITSYTNEDDVKRIVLNDVDISLSEFYEYLKLIDGTKESREEFHFKECVYIGATASFVTGILVCFVTLLVCLLTT